MRLRHCSGLLLLALVIQGCSDSGTPPPQSGPLSRLTVRSGSAQTALAGTVLPAPIIIVPQDDEGRTVVGQTATFHVSGGGSLSSTTGQVNSDGSITAPAWTLGESAVIQEMRVTVGVLTITITATVQTAYELEVRFFGAPVAAANRTLFTRAAARISAIVVGSLPAEDVTGLDISECTGKPTPILTGSIAGLVIYASVDSIDGAGRTLAFAGPCYIRGTEAAPDWRTLIGRMQFDSADIASLADNNNLQDVITHEMLHVVGLGTFWGPRGLIINSGQNGAAFTGQGAIAACRATGGSAICTSSVPVEDCEGLPEAFGCGDGQREGHWKETRFRTELMTPYLSSTANLLSVMTIRSLADLGYSVNPAAADPYTVPTPSFSLPGGSPSSLISASPRWERALPVAPRTLPRTRLAQPRTP